MGYIYFIRESGGDFFKVGLTKSGKDGRLAGLQTGNVRPLLLYGCIEYVDKSLAKAETKIHDELKAFHARGEWFSIREDFVNAFILSRQGTIINSTKLVLPPQNGKFIVVNTAEIRHRFFPAFIVWSLIFPAMCYFIFGVIKLISVAINLGQRAVP